MKKRSEKATRSGWGRLLRAVVGLAIVGGGVYISYDWITHKPKARKRFGAYHRQAPLVEVIRPKPCNAPALVETFGTVVPYRTQTLSSRVSSQIVHLSEKLVPGGIVKKGELLMELDESDYRLALREKASAVAAARLALETELENQKSAAFEFSLSERNVSERQKAFILREPHVAAAKAALKAAEAAYEKAKLDLARCRIRAPFDAVVLEVRAAEGDVVGASGVLATLARADRFWVRAAVALRELEGIDVPGYNAQKGSRVSVARGASFDKKIRWEGVVEEVEKAVDESSRMAYLLVGVEDPLGAANGRSAGGGLLLGEYVYLKIFGKTLTNVLRIPSGALRGDDTLWIAGADGRLHIRKVSLVWREEGRFYIDAKLLAPGEAIVTTVLETPVEGMRLRIEGKEAALLAAGGGASRRRGDDAETGRREGR